MEGSNNSALLSADLIHNKATAELEPRTLQPSSSAWSDLLFQYNFHVMMLVLLVVDVLFTITSIGVEIQFLETEGDQCTAFACLGAGVCNTMFGNHNLNEIGHLLGYISIAITSLFVLELLALLLVISV